MRLPWRAIPLSARQQVLVGSGLLLSLVSWLVLRPWDMAGWMIGAPFGRDYVNFWMAPRLVLAGQGAQLVDLAAYGKSIVSAFGLGSDPDLVFVYPPHALLFLAPFALLPFVPALCLWTASNLMALAATLRFCGASTMARSTQILLVCLSPAAATMVIYGHFGGLLALASTLAITESERRPWLAGLCLACLTVKPQYAGILGLILLFSGRWRWLPFAATGTLALVGLSVAAFGIETWHRFLGITVPFQSAIVSEFKSNWIVTSVTPYFTARFWGAPALAAWAIQAAVAVGALASAVLVLRGRRRGGPPTPAALTVILLAAIVSLPYASHYDLAAVAPAMTLLVLDDATGSEASLFTLAAWLTVPLALILVRAGLPVLSLVLVAALLWESRRLLGGRRSLPGTASLPLPAAGQAS